MDLEHLSEREKLVLIGLYHWVMNSDGVVSPQEEAALLDLSHRLADPDWKGLVAESRIQYPDMRTLAHAARRLARPEARQLIYTELLRLAEADAYHLAEVQVLDWLAGLWGFLSDGDPPPPAPFD